MLKMKLSKRHRLLNNILQLNKLIMMKIMIVMNLYSENSTNL